MKSKEKTLDFRIKEVKYVKGLPFTLSFKKMFEKTIASRFKDGEQNIIQLTKLGIENSESFVNIKENKYYFSVEFDGQGVSSEEALVKLMLSLYSDESKENKENRLGRLGTAIASALSKKPLEVLVETHHNGSGICMKVDGNLKPVIYKPKYNLENNKITIIKRKPTTKAVIGDFFDVLSWPAQKIGSIFIKNKNPLKIRKEKIAEMSKFTDKKVTYKGKKQNQGFRFDNSLFQEEYKIGDSRILLSIPLRNHGEHKKIHYLKKDIPIEESVFDYFDSEWRSFFGGINLNNSDSKDETIRKKFEYIITPNVLVSNPKLESNISEDRIIQNNVFEQVKKDIEEAKIRFYMDFLKGKFDKTDTRPWSLWSPEATGREEFLKALFLTRIKNKNLKLKSLEEYAKDSEAFLAKLSENEAGELKRFFSIKLFSDIDGNKYTIPEAYKIIEKNKEDDMLTIYYLSKKIKREHPALVGKIEPNKKVLLFENNKQLELFETIFSVKTRAEYKISVANKRANDKNSGNEDIVIAESLDGIVDTYYWRKRAERREKIENTKRICKKVAKIGGATTAAGGTIVGGYYAMPWIIAIGGGVWSGIYAAAEFVAANLGAIGYGAGASGAAFGTYKIGKKTLPKIKKSSKSLLKSSKELLKSEKHLIGKSAKILSRGFKFIGKTCQSLVEKLDGEYQKTKRGLNVRGETIGKGYSVLEGKVGDASEFVGGTVISMGNKIGLVWSGFTKYAIKKPIKGFSEYAVKRPAKKTLSFIGKKLTDIGSYIDKKEKEIREARKVKKEKTTIEQRKIIEEFEKIKAEELKKYNLKFGEQFRVLKHFETYFDYLIGAVQKGYIKDEYKLLSEVEGIEIVERYGRRAFVIRHHDETDWLQINISSSELEQRAKDFYESKGRTLFADLQDIGNLAGKYSLNNVSLVAKREELNGEIIRSLHRVELEDTLIKYQSNKEEFKDTFKSLGIKDKKYVLKRIIEVSRENNEKSSLEKWLVNDYGELLEEVSGDMISDKEINLVRKTINREDSYAAIELFDELTQNEKAKLVTEGYYPDKTGVSEISRATESLDAHIRTTYPFLKLNAVLIKKFENSENINLKSVFCYEDEASRLAYTSFANGNESLFNEILWPSLHDEENTKREAPWKRSMPHQVRMRYYKIGELSDMKRAMEICLGAFYTIEDEKKQEFLEKVRKDLFKNPYYQYFVETILQYEPEYKEIFTSSDILV